jgi:hypothetical protein
MMQLKRTDNKELPTARPKQPPINRDQFRIAVTLEEVVQSVKMSFDYVLNLHGHFLPRDGSLRRHHRSLEGHATAKPGKESRKTKGLTEYGMIRRSQVENPVFTGSQ